ncbi:MAG: TonB-dependent receptor plug domain-containing protein [Elusimicrobiota bacterium]
MKKLLFSSLILGACLLFAGKQLLFSQTHADESLLFKELPKVTIASKKPMSVEETPGIVTVITEEDIKNSGASDLLEALRLLVPGFHFGNDVEGVVGVGVRGIWSHEGKVSLMIDGQEVNEEQFATTQYGNHYPVDNIKRIEIIRGAGSVIYGGYAGVGVINIITKGVEQDGSFVSTAFSQMQNTYSRRNVTFGYGKEVPEEKMGFSITGSYGLGMRSERDNIDSAGNAMTMEDNSELNIAKLNTNLNFGGWDLRAIVDRYRTTQFVNWGTNYTKEPIEEDFDTYIFNVKYDFKEVFGENLTVTPEYNYKVQYPWQFSTNPEELDYSNEKRVERQTMGLSANWNITRDINLLTGVEHSILEFKWPDIRYEAGGEFVTGGDSLDYTNDVVYSQMIWKNKLFNTTIGGRYENSEEFGDSFVPRIAITKEWDVFHAKAMYSQTFRTPGGIIPTRIPEDKPAIKPEYGENIELEIGYKINDRMDIVLSGYDITFDDVIVYDADTEGDYYNADEIGTRGMEAVYHFNKDKYSLDWNYAYYLPTKRGVDLYNVEDRDSYFLGFPPHRSNIVAGYEITDNVSVHPSLSFFGERYGYKYDEEEDGLALKEFEPLYLTNLNIRSTDIFRKGFDITLGVKNIFDENYSFLQGYNNGLAPSPSKSREFYLKLNKSF